MKVLLALDTSSGSTGTAVAEAGRVLASIAEAKPYRHSENLFAQIDAVLLEASLAKEDLTGIVVTRGPGSFTGLRVGLATAKGLAAGLGLPIAGVSSLAALAEPHWSASLVTAPVFDARKGQIYGAAYGKGGEPLLPECAWDPAVFTLELKKLALPVTFSGSGIDPYGRVFKEILGDNFTAVPQESWFVDPASVARLGYAEFAAGRMTDPVNLVPVYLRRSEAEENASGRGPGRSDGATANLPLAPPSR